MFRGVKAVTVDGKGRFAMPTCYRDVLLNNQQSHLVVTMDTESPCLLLYPQGAWEIIEQQVNGLPSFNQAARRIQRLLVGHATELELDSHGRLLLPALLRSYAHIEKNMMLVGQGKKFELWGESHWEEERAKWLSLSFDDGALPEALKQLAL
ncbi:MAG: division/cell wall cluster transcriptional repressor MraZ [Gammaproteobacteria bacterium]